MKVILATLLVLLMSSVYSQPALDKSPRLLEAATFDEEVKDTKDTVSVVFFGADWCHHCKVFKPKYQKISEAHFGTTLDSGATLKFYLHFGEGNSDATKKFKIRGYPTIVAIESGRYWVYKGRREEESILEWVKSRKEEDAKEYPTHVPGFIEEFMDAMATEYERNPTSFYFMVGMLGILALLIVSIVGFIVYSIFWGTSETEDEEETEKESDKKER